MKTIVNFSLLLPMLCISMHLQAQRISLKVAMNMTDMYFYNEAEGLGRNFNTLKSMQAGIMYEKILTNYLSLESSLMVTGKGAMIVESDLSSNRRIENSLRFTYVEVPVCLKVYHDFNGAKLFAQAGLSGSVALMGSSEISTKTPEGIKTSKSSIQWGIKERTHPFRRLDYGLLVGAGVEFGRVQLGLSCQWGEANIYLTEGREVYHAVLAFSTAFRLTD